MDQNALSRCRISQIPRPRGRGLIEAECKQWATSEIAVIPRPRGRGLIEARDSSPGWGRTEPIPRPRGRGLIEAKRHDFSVSGFFLFLHTPGGGGSANTPTHRLE